MFFGLLPSTRTIFSPSLIHTKRGCNVPGQIDRPAASESQGAALAFRTPSSPDISSVVAGWSSHFYKTKGSLATEPHRFGRLSTASKDGKKQESLSHRLLRFQRLPLQNLVGI